MRYVSFKRGQRWTGSNELNRSRVDLLTSVHNGVVSYSKAEITRFTDFTWNKHLLLNPKINPSEGQILDNMNERKKISFLATQAGAQTLKLCFSCIAMTSPLQHSRQGWLTTATLSVRIVRWWTTITIESSPVHCTAVHTEKPYKSIPLVTNHAGLS